jgi:probable HAF family extracellular repeat protein
VGPNVFAGDLNAAGQVVGAVYSSNGLVAHAFVYSNGVIKDLGVPGTYNYAQKINDSGQISGTFVVPGGSFGQITDYRTFVWNGGVTTNLNPTGWGQTGLINNAGQVAGISGPYGAGQYNYMAVIYYHGSIIQLGKPDSDAGVNVTAINNGGDVVAGGLKPTIWSKGKWSNIASSNGLPQGINDIGQIVGFQIVGGSDTIGCFFANGQMIPIPGTLELDDINNLGQAVGRGGSSAAPHAILYDKGVRQDLNEMIAPGLGFTLSTATSLNDAGQIAAFGSNAQGVYHSFILTPVGVPEPGATALLLCGAWLLRRRRARPEFPQPPGVPYTHSQATGM